MSDARTTHPEATGDASRHLHVRVMHRLSAALADLFLPGQARLTDWQRSTMAALLAKLIRSIEDELRVRLAKRFPAEEFAGLHAALTASHVEIALPILERSRALHDNDLVSLLFRRVEEHRLSRSTHSPLVAQGSLLLELVRDPDEQVAEAAMAVLIRQNRRLDAFQEPLFASADLPAELEHGLVWRIAAALRSYIVDRHSVGPAVADRAIAAAAGRRLSSYDESDALEARALMLARRLADLDRLGDDLVVRTLADAGLPLMLAALAIRCDLAVEAVWEIACDPSEGGAPLLMRAARLGRVHSGQLLAALAAGTSGADERLVRQLDLFDTTSVQEARSALQLWRIDPSYRAAIARLYPPPFERRLSPPAVEQRV